MLLCAFVSSISLSSCGKDDDELIEEPPQYPLDGTRWTYTDLYEIDGDKISLSYVISFSKTTAVLKLTETINYADGSTYQNPAVNQNYKYTYNDGLVILTPTDPNIAYLEGSISSGIKMELYNVSNGGQIGVFYKE